MPCVLVPAHLVFGLRAVEEFLKLVLGKLRELVVELVRLVLGRGRKRLLLLLLERRWRRVRVVRGWVLELRAVWFESLVHSIPEVVILCSS